MSCYNVISHNFRMYVTEIMKFPCQLYYNKLISSLIMICKSFIIYSYYFTLML